MFVFNYLSAIMCCNLEMYLVLFFYLCVCMHMHVYVCMLASMWTHCVGVQMHVCMQPHRGPSFMSGIILNHSSTCSLRLVSVRPRAHRYNLSLLLACSGDPLSLLAEARISRCSVTPTRHLCEFWGSKLWASHILGKHFDHRVIFQPMEELIYGSVRWPLVLWTF